jgi:uncharacterized protein YbjQ (UPF0145 family)
MVGKPGQTVVSLLTRTTLTPLALGYSPRHLFRAPVSGALAGPHECLKRQPGDRMTLTTTPSVEGRTIRNYLGIVTGEAIVGANIFQDLFANIRDIVGGRSAAYEQELARARTIALDELKNAAQQLGADAVVGIDLDYEVLGTNNGMLMVSVSGTAVKLA